MSDQEELHTTTNQDLTEKIEEIVNEITDSVQVHADVREEISQIIESIGDHQTTTITTTTVEITEASEDDNEPTTHTEETVVEESVITVTEAATVITTTTTTTTTTTDVQKEEVFSLVTPESNPNEVEIEKEIIETTTITTTEVEETTETVVTPHGSTSVLESEDSVTVTTITYETTDHGDHVSPEKHDDVVLTESVTHHSEHHVNSIVSTTTVTDHTETRTIHTSADSVVDVQVEEHTDVTVSKEVVVNGNDVVLEITEQVNDVTITEFHNPHDPNQSKIEIEEVFTAIEKNVSEVASPELPGITTDEVAVVETSTETITVTTHTTMVENEVVVKDEVETVQAEVEVVTSPDVVGIEATIVSKEGTEEVTVIATETEVIATVTVTANEEEVGEKLEQPPSIAANALSSQVEEEVKYSVTLDASTRWYENLKTYSSNAAVAEATSIAVNSHFFAYLESQGSGSSIAVLPYTSVGKNHIPVNSPAYQQPIIRAHSQPVSDFAFNPFHSQILYSCAPDRLLKLWKLPSTEGLTVDMSVATNSLSLKSKCALRSLAVSKSIDSLLAVRGSREISIFDMNALKEVYTTTDNNSFWSGDILSMTWSYYNDLLFTSSKDKMIKLFDPRVNPKQFSLVKDWIAHSGFRYSSVIPLEDTFSVYTLGHNSKTQEREVYYWDLRSINPSTGPIIKHVIDKKDGNLFPIYDEDHKLLYVSGKGDSHLHTYQLSSDRTQLNELINENILTESFHGRDVIKGIALLPKIPSLITNNREVGRILKLSDGLIQPYSINASQPLPSEGFITRSGAPAALTASQWVAGEIKPPRTVVVVAPDTATNTSSNTPTASDKDDSTSQKSESRPDSSSDVTNNNGGSGMGKRSSVSRVSQSTMKYRHLYGKEPKKELTYFGLQPDLTALDSPIIAGNEHYWAIPYRGGGGPVYLSKHSTYGKVLPECLTLNGHKSTVQDIAFSPFHENLMLTGSFDCTIKLWDVQSALDHYQVKLQEEQERQLKFYGKNKTLPTSINVSYNESIGSFHQHTNSIRTINFHPTIPSLFCSTSQDMTLRFFDLNNIEEISSLKVFGNVGSVSDALITNISFNYDGTQLLMASKDRQLRSIDPRMNQITNTVQHAKYLGRNLRVAWCARSLAEDPVVTVSAGSGGLRQIALWDRRNWSEPLVVRMIDNASGQLYPMYDEGLNVVYVAGKGDTMIRGYELSSLTTDPSTDTKEGGGEKGEKEYHYMMEKCFDYQVQGRDTIAGICMLPKRVVDIRAVEVSRILKLSNDSVNEIHFHVPRADYLKDYFHDDIYLPIRSNTESKGTIYDWKSSTSENNELFAPVLESLKPEGMINVSEKPVTPLPSESNSKIHSYRNKIAAKEEETKQNEEKFNKLQQLAFQNAQYHRNSSGPMRIGSVVVTNPQLQESIAKVSAQGGNDDDSDDEVDWS